MNVACAAAALGVMVAGCGGSTAPVDRRQQTHPATSATPAAISVTAVSSIKAPFKLPAAVSRPVVYPVGAELLVVGGLTSSGSTTRAMLRVDPAQGKVQSAGKLPVPVHDAGGVLVGSRYLLFGGGSTAVNSEVQDVTPGRSPRVLSHLPHPRADLVAISDGNTGYVLGGYDGTQGSTTILQTRDGKGFAVTGTLPVSVRYPAVAISGGSIWLFGGEHAGVQVDDVQRIDLKTGHESIAGHLPRPISHEGAFALGGSIFIAGGRNGSRALDTVMRFDPATMAFKTAGRLPDARSDFGTAVVGGVAYLVGGENTSPVDSIIEVRARGTAK